MAGSWRRRQWSRTAGHRARRGSRRHVPLGAGATQRSAPERASDATNPIGGERHNLDYPIVSAPDDWGGVALALWRPRGTPTLRSRRAVERGDVGVVVAVNLEHDVVVHENG